MKRFAKIVGLGTVIWFISPEVIGLAAFGITVCQEKLRDAAELRKMEHLGLLR